MTSSEDGAEPGDESNATGAIDGEAVVGLGQLGHRPTLPASRPSAVGPGSAEVEPEDDWTAAVEREQAVQSLFPGSADPPQLGRYVLLGTLGKGGMGTVFEAFDRTLDRRVAIKVLRHAADEHTLRLVREAQAMAKLSHPNVVQVYEVGRAMGRAFVVMERVQGQTLRTWIQRSPRPTWRECVEVFIPLGQGLAAAHAQGLVHRDFKPGNAIIDDEGRARVLDFGLARRVDGDRSPSDPSFEVGTGSGSEREPSPTALGTPLTRTGAILGTPAYMAPEQMCGGEADARSDQFSFCVALWEALYEQRPYRGKSLGALASAIVSGTIEPVPKATMVPHVLRQVLLRGLSRQPDERWSSMDALLSELRACVAPRRRGRWVLGAGLVVALVGLGAALAYQADVERQIERARQAERAQRCTGARAHLQGVWDDDRRRRVRDAVLGTALPYASDTWERVRSRLDAYADAWATKHTEVCEATSVRGEQTEEVMALRMTCVHDGKVALDAAVRVLADADRSVVIRAVTLAQSLPGLERCDDLLRLQRRRQRVPPPEDPPVGQQVKAVREQVVRLRAEREAGRYADALAHVEPLVQRAEALGYGPLLAEVLVQRGITRERNERLVQAEQDLERAFAIAAEHGLDTEAAKAAAMLTRVVGRGRGRHERALWWAEIAVPLSRGPGVDAMVEAFALSSLGNIQQRRGELAPALLHHQQALAIDEQVLGKDHTTIAKALNNIGRVLAKQGKLAEASTYFRRALAIDEGALGNDHPAVALSLKNIGNMRAKQGELSEALAYYDRALAIDEGALGEEHTAVARTLGNIGLVLARQGRLSDALRHHQRALAIDERALGGDHPRVAVCLSNVADVLGAQGELVEARRHYQRALAIGESAWGHEHADLAYPLVGLAEVELQQRDFDAARGYAERAVAIRKARDAAPELLAAARFVLARALWDDRAERERANALARQAREGLAAAEGRSAVDLELGEIEAWLAEHSLP